MRFGRAAFAIFGDNGTYRHLAMAWPVTADGLRVWTIHPHGTAALSPLAARQVAIKEMHLGVPVVTGADGAAARAAARPAAVGGSGPEFGGVPGTIGGDHSAWYTGLAGGAVTSVAL